MRSFYFYEAGGPQDRDPVGIAHSGKEAVEITKNLTDGDYNIRDCLGGLKRRLRVAGDVVSLLPMGE